MKKTPELKNLVFENILSESLKFYPPTEGSYIKTYPEFIQFFKNINNISKHDLVISSHFVYGWMPTIIELKFQDMEGVLKSLNKAKNGSFNLPLKTYTVVIEPLYIFTREISLRKLLFDIKSLELL